MLPPQGYAPAPLWGMTRPPHHHQNQQFYSAAGTFPGAARHQAPAPVPIGSHNQFIPLQVGQQHSSGTSGNPFLCCCCDGFFLPVSSVFKPTQLSLSWQVTKKRISANKKNQETQEFYSAAQTAARHQSQRGQNQSAGQSQAQSGKVKEPHQHSTDGDASSSSPAAADGVSTTEAAAHTPPRQTMPSTGHTPGSASRRKHRKLAVNFEAAKVSE